MNNHPNRYKQYLLASDFDQTLSFNDSGHVLAEMLVISGFQEKVAGLSRSNLVHQGAELAYLLRHDPQFRSVRREHLAEAGRRVRLRDDIKFAHVCCGSVLLRCESWGIGRGDFSAAGNTRGVAPGIALASVSTLGYLGFLIGPPFIGFAAELLGLRSALGTIVVTSMIAVTLAPIVGPKQKPESIL